MYDDAPNWMHINYLCSVIIGLPHGHLYTCPWPTCNVRTKMHKHKDRFVVGLFQSNTRVHTLITRDADAMYC